MPSPRKIVVRSYLEKDEYHKLKKLSSQTGLSISSFIKKVCLGQNINATIDYESYLALLKANADLGRIGGLLKLAISKGLSGQQTGDFRTILRDIERNQNILTKQCRIVAENLTKKQK